LGKYDHIPLSLKLPNDRLTEQQVREKLRKERNVEHLYIYKNGRQLARFEGYKAHTAVNVPAEWLVRMKDATVYHNHLGSTSFSFEDIELIVANDAKEFVVCSPKFDYIVRRPVGGWDFQLAVTNNMIVLDQDSAEIFEESQSLATQLFNTTVAQGHLRNSEWGDMRMHFIWSAFFGIKEIHYKQLSNQ